MRGEDASKNPINTQLTKYPPAPGKGRWPAAGFGPAVYIHVHPSGSKGKETTVCKHRQCNRPVRTGV